MIRTSFLIASLQLIAISIGIGWNVFFESVYPTLTLLPVSVVTSFMLVTLFLPSYGSHISQAQNKTVIRSILEVSILAAAIAVIIGAAFGLLTSFFRPSVGKILFLFLSTLIHSVVSLLAANTVTQKTVDALLRTNVAKIAFSFLFGAIVCGVMVGLLELSFFTLNHIKIGDGKSTSPAKQHTGTYLESEAFFRQDRDLGVALHPNRKVRSGLKIGDKALWETTYSTDNSGRRTTVNPSPAGTIEENKRPFAIFFGCSYLFGEGCLDQETIPSRFAANSPHFESFNYGVPGYGTQHMLAIVDNPQFQKQFSGRSGMGFYLYLEDIHEARVIGDMDIVTSFGENFPCYMQSGVNGVERLGSFRTGRPFRQAAFQLLAASQTRKYFGLNFPKRTDADYKLVATIISTARDKFESAFPGSKFFVIRYPHPNAHRKIDSHLSERRVSVIDLSDLFDPNLPKYQFVGDGHPTPIANDEVAKELTNRLKKND